MQENAAERKFSRIISRRNTEQYKKYKVTSKFIVLFIFGIAIGISYAWFTFNTMTYDRNIYINAIKNHFDSIFSECNTLSDYSLNILKASRNDIRYLFYIFIGGFTYFCFFAAGLIVFSKGLIVGYSATCLFCLSNWLDGMISFKLLFILYSFVTSVIVIGLSSVAYSFSFEFRAIKRNRSVLMRAPIAYRFIFSLIWSLGGLLTVNMLYCLFVYIIS